MSRKKTLLFLGADNFHAYTWKDGVLSAPQRFEDDAAGREQFAAFLQTHRDPVYLLTDFIEEDFRYETVGLQKCGKLFTPHRIICKTLRRRKHAILPRVGVEVVSA